MLIVGLTGSIGMGKSTAARRFEDYGVPVFDADAEVHRLYQGKVAEAIGQAFPGSLSGGQVDRARLAEQVLSQQGALSRLEAIIHPLVHAAERAFLAEHAGRNAAMAVLEIPLLFETGADQWVDLTVVVVASPESQRERVLARAGMTTEKFEVIRAQQMPDQEKCARADFVVDTDGPIEKTAAEIDKIIESVANREGQAIDRWLAEGS